MVVQLEEICLERISRSLSEDFSKVHVVVMPDFFLDRILTLPWDSKRFSEKIDQVICAKGGSIDNINQVDQRGGNAMNTASALAALGVSVTPIVCTNKFGAQLIKSSLSLENVDLSHIKIFDNPSVTTALEFPGKDGDRINVMLRDNGSLSDFGPQHLSEKDFNLIEKADYVCVFNWAGTRRYGEELAEEVFSRVKTMGKGKTYYDGADPTPNKTKIEDLALKVLQSGKMDILSLNENEAIVYSDYVSREEEKLTKTENRAVESAEKLARKLSSRIDLHTANFSASFTRTKSCVVPTFNVPMMRATGAGDSWNAGNIIGDALGLTDECRLTLANAVAAYYVSSKHGEHPNRKQLARFVAKADTRENTFA